MKNRTQAPQNTENLHAPGPADPARFLRTDLACEGPNTDDVRRDPPGAHYHEYRLGTLSVARLTIEDTRGAEHFGRGIGTYVTVTCPGVLTISEEEHSTLRETLAAELRRMAESAMGTPITKNSRILVVGLGNARMTADALGPLTVRGIPITRHFENDASPALRDIRQKSASIAAVSPGVLAETGIETVELIRGAVQSVTPDLLIAVDALAARSCERLASTVQLSDTGLCPGSGVGNHREALNRESIGCPVIALGVPTVVDSSALVYDALFRAGITGPKVTPELLEVLENGTSFFVSPKEIDALTAFFAELLADAIETALSAKDNCQL